MQEYAKLEEFLAKEKGSAKQSAYKLIVGLGWDAAKCATAHYVRDDLKEEDKERAALIARRITATDITTFLGLIQREFETEPTDGERLPPYPTPLDRICPVCKKDMGDDCWDGSESEYDSEGGVTAWECPHCGATGRAIYGTPPFLTHADVVDGEGTPFIVPLK